MQQERCSGVAEAAARVSMGVDSQVFMAEPFNAEVDRLEATGRGLKSSSSAPSVLPSAVQRGDPNFRQASF